jgi:microcystin degradation protein MlrC
MGTSDDGDVGPRRVMTPSRPLRIGLAACFHETNTFATHVTDLASFRVTRGGITGEGLLDDYTGTRTVLGGMLDGAEEHGLQLVPILGAFATPAGIVTRTAFDAILGQLVGALGRAGPLDGLLLELHGAMVVEGETDPETVLLEAIRDRVGELPIVAVTDLHANMTAARVGHLDALIGYQTNPHVDTYERGVDAARHVAALVRGGLETVLLHRRVPVLAAPIAQRTAEPPLSDLLATARELESRYGLVDVTIHAGYAYADVPHAGLSFTVTAPTERAGPAAEVLDVLAHKAWDHRELFTVDLPAADAAIAEAERLLARRGGPVAVADTGDNINGGGPGDTTWLLRTALERSRAPVAGTLCDPATVRAAEEAGVGASFDASLGGRARILSGGPLRGPARVRWVGDGTFVNTGPMATGRRVSMGPTAVLEFDRAQVIVQSLPTQPNDPEMFRAVGLPPEEQGLVLLKGAAALRAGWGPIVSGSVDAGTPGVTDCDLRRLPYRHAHGVWPLDPHASLHLGPTVEETSR